MARVFLSLGSNSRRYYHIGQCLDALSAAYAPLTLSSVFESQSVGFQGNPFLNMVVGFDTESSLEVLSTRLKLLEDQYGRFRGGPKYAPRTLDIDILLFDDLQGSFSGVELPRGEILENAFVLWPLAEIAGEMIHPTAQQTIHELWAAYDKNKQALAPVVFDWHGRQL